MVVVYKPRFAHPLLQYILRRVSQSGPGIRLGITPHVRVRLDKMSSTVWKQMDGRKTIGVIAGIIKKEYGEKAEPLYPRLKEFFTLLVYNNMCRVVRKNQDG